MKKLRFSVKRTIVGNFSNVAYVQDGEDPADAVLRTAWEDMSISVDLTISGVTMFAAAWADPEHWSTDWAEKLDIEYDDVGEAVAALFSAAVEET